VPTLVSRGRTRSRRSVDQRPVFAQAGISLLEVLVAIVVLSIGLLGLAGLQFSALRGNNQSYERSQAHILAGQIADAMRANRVAAAAGAFVIDTDDDPVAAVSCTPGPCTRAQAAQFALANWHDRLTAELPGGTARITCSTTPCQQGVFHTVSIIWDENRTGATDDSCPAPNLFDPDTHLSCVQASFVP
jgi:type IV pilus assembly protein PilV